MTSRQINSSMGEEEGEGGKRRNEALQTVDWMATLALVGGGEGGGKKKEIDRLVILPLLAVPFPLPDCEFDKSVDTQVSLPLFFF